jgi:hypothetical protein
MASGKLLTEGHPCRCESQASLFFDSLERLAVGDPFPHNFELPPTHHTAYHAEVSFLALRNQCIRRSG